MTEPLCPYFGKCGGCSSQHIAYDVQLDNKRKQLSQSIKYDQDSIEIFSGEPYNYRNRMDFIFHKSGLGLREKGDWKSIVDIERCAISDERLNELLKYVREYFKDIGDEAFDVKRHSGTFRYAVIRTPSNDSSISFVLNSDSSNNGEAVSKIKEFAKHTKANNVVVTYVPSNTDVSISEEFFVVKGSDMLNEDYVDRSFSYSVQGFFQNNSAMAESMQEHVQSLIKKYDTKDLTLLDLYCGVGTFGIINSS